MFERFTQQARQVVTSAQYEARRLRHDYIGTEHLLLALLQEPEGVAAEALRDLSIRADEARAQVVRLVGKGKAEDVNGARPFTPRAKKTLELAMREAEKLGDRRVGAEHLLLGLARLNEGVGPVILAGSGAPPPKIAAAVVDARGGSAPAGYVEGFSEEEPSAAKVVATERTGLLVSGALLFLLAFGVGILVGWLVWGL